MASITRSDAPSSQVGTVDPTGRVLLPKEFANATVTIEVLSGSEVRIQRTADLPGSEETFMEERLAPLSDRDRDFFLDLLDNPPEPTPALRTAMARHKQRHG